jgi:hypothetical protein
MRLFMIFACLGTIAGSLVSVPAAQAAGKVIPAEIAQLVDVSERIVLAKVESVEDRTDLKIRRAKATVKEVWKGPKVETVEYQITPRLFDNSQAVPGETVLLFLAKRDGDWRIAWSGHGRMTLETQDSKEYLGYFDVIFPDGTPSVVLSENKKGPFSKGVELKLVKELVLGKK